MMVFKFGSICYYYYYYYFFLGGRGVKFVDFFVLYFCLICLNFVL
jgi:hypothetical protein